MKKKLRKLSLRRETVSVLDLGRATGAAPQPITEDTGPGTCCCLPPPESGWVETGCCSPLTGGGGGGTGGGFGGGGYDEVVS
jgi:hypothetical protein